MWSVYNFLSTIEQIVENEVKGNYPRYWDEDFITQSLLRSLRKEFGPRVRVGLDVPPLPYRVYWWGWFFPAVVWPVDWVVVEWDIYKLRGFSEQRFGDVAILVTTKYPDKDKVEGVAFLEAKKLYPKSSDFQAIDFAQLRRINTHAPRASVLLYNYRQVYPYDWWYTYAATVPMDLVIATRKKDISLYKFSLPFSVQLLTHLFGFCLERADEPLNIAKGYLAEYGSPLYLVVARVGIGVEPPSSNEIEFSRDRFTRLEE